MGEYSKLIQAFDPERHLLLIIPPDVVETMYTARSGGPGHLRPLDLWVDQFLSQYVGHKKWLVIASSNPKYILLGIMAKALDSSGVPHPTPQLLHASFYM